MTRQQKIIATGVLVAKLKKGQIVTFLNPVAEERAKIMKRHYLYQPYIYDPYTLKPNN